MRCPSTKHKRHCITFRDRRSLFPENPRPPPGLDSCVSGQGFRGLAPSSATSLEGRPIDSALLRWFPGVSRSLLTISGEKSCGPTFFVIRQGDAFVTHQYFQNEQNGAKKRYKSQISILRDWIAPVTAGIVWGGLKRFSCEF